MNQSKLRSPGWLVVLTLLLFIVVILGVGFWWLDWLIGRQ
jgi:hypothetical protein